MTTEATTEATVDPTIAALDSISLEASPDLETVSQQPSDEVVAEETTDTSDEESSGDEEVTTEETEQESEVEGTDEDEDDDVTKDYPESVRVKVDGEEMEVSFQDLVKGYSHSQGAAKKMQEASQMQKQTVEFIRLLQSDPMSVLSDPSLGIDLRTAAEDYLVKQLQRDEMTPEQVELEETKQRLAQYEAEQRRIQSEQESAAIKEQSNLIGNSIKSALSEANMPVNDYTFKRVAHYMRESLNQGTPLQAADVISLVANDYKTEMRQFFSGSDENTLIDMLGEDGVGKIRKFDTSRLRQNGGEKRVTPDKQGRPIEREDKSDSKKKMSTSEFLRSIGQ